MLPDHVTARSWEYINGLNLGQQFRAKVEAFTNDKRMTWMRDQGVIPKAIACLPFVQTFWIKCGHRGLISIAISPRSFVTEPESSTMSFRHKLDGSVSTGQYLNICHYPARKRLEADEVVSTTGAGDTVSGSLVAGLCLAEVQESSTSYKSDSSDQEDVGKFVKVAMERAERSIRSRRAVG
jgi:pseudouridine-5'-phosphate glycosidase/pseudouridine kinase